MTRDHSDLSLHACLLQIGPEIVPVYGNEQTGWTVELGDLSFQVPGGFRYRTLEELYFALVTLTVNDNEGQA